MSTITLHLLNLSESDLPHFFVLLEETQSRLQQVMKTGRFSFGLVVELTDHLLNNRYQIEPIIREIAILEAPESGSSFTKAAEPFRGSILKGLWHKHHYQPEFLFQNLHLAVKHAGLIDTGSAFIGTIVNNQTFTEMVKQILDHSFQNRADQRGLTGQWIIYESGSSGNYYLTLGSHGEDECIMARVRNHRQIDLEIERQTSDYAAGSR